MKIGKLPEPVLIRSVLKQVKHRRPEVLVGPSVGQDCAALQVGPEEVLVMSTDPITGTVKDLGSHCIHITANDLAASGAEPLGVMLTILLPDTMEEPQLRRLMQEAEKTCEELNIEVLGDHTEITNVVRQPLISVTGVGKIPRRQLTTLRHIEPGQDVVVTKWIGLEATAILAKECEEELSARFPAGLVDVAKGFGKYPDCRGLRRDRHARHHRGRRLRRALGDGQRRGRGAGSGYEENPHPPGDGGNLRIFRAESLSDHVQRIHDDCHGSGP